MEATVFCGLHVLAFLDNIWIVFNWSQCLHWSHLSLLSCFMLKTHSQTDNQPQFTEAKEALSSALQQNQS